MRNQIYSPYCILLKPTTDVEQFRYCSVVEYRIEWPIQILPMLINREYMNFNFIFSSMKNTGIEYLCENHLLQMDPQDIADFLYKGEGLNKTAIGDYLGEKNDFNEQVLKAFVDLHDFTNLILVQALR